MGSVCQPQKILKNVDKRNKVRHYTAKELADKTDKKKIGASLEHNAAVDYAIRKAAQRENYFVLELQISCENLP
jgi:hypothetical protein